MEISERLKNLQMVVVPPNEVVEVSGELLVSGQPDCGSAFVMPFRDPNARKFHVEAGTHEDATFYGFCTESCRINTQLGWVALPPFSYWCSPRFLTVSGGAGVVICRTGYVGLLAVGGPLEPCGRLRYIDGCNDTMLIGPPLRGEPCLNHLHFPTGIRQTMHTHPSLRCGSVARGEGRAQIRTAAMGPDDPNEEMALRPGDCWLLPTDGQHCFHTDEHTMDVIAWHPDSDVGPTHHDHAMLNRTLVEGRSAKNLDDIRTTAIVR